MKFRLVLVLFILDLTAIGTTIGLYISQFFIFGPMMGTLAALLSSIIALFLPLIIKHIDQSEEKEKIIKSREKGYSAFEELCDFYLEQFDAERGIPRDNIEVIDRTKMISQVETIYTYRDELFPMGIIISSGWKDVEGNHNIYIHTTEELDFRILAHDFGKIKKIELKYRGDFIRDKSEISQLLKKFKIRIKNDEV